MSFEEWLASMPSTRKKPLSQAHTKLLETGWSEAYAKFSSFIKLEALPHFDKNKHGITPLKTMLDRLIQGPNDATHCIAGPVLKPLIHLLKKRWHEDNAIFYGSTTPEHLHNWLTKTLIPAGGTYFWCDFSMYDNTHSNDSWDFMEKLYKQSVGDNDLFWKVMRAWRAPSGRMGPFKYKARVMNASGRDDTALANGVLNGFATYLSACAAWLRVPLKQLTPSMVNSCREDIKLSVCGDDSLGRIPSCSYERRLQFCRDMKANIAEFGFEAKLQASEKLYDAVYLGMRPYPTRKGWYWGKTIGRSTYKMGWVGCHANQDTMALMTGIAEMHTLCSNHVPVLSDLAQQIVALRQGAKKTLPAHDPNKPWQWTLSGAPYDDLTLDAVVDIYNTRLTMTYESSAHCSAVTRHELDELIHRIRSITRLPAVIDNELWRRMIWLDDL